MQPSQKKFRIRKLKAIPLSLAFLFAVGFTLLIFKLHVPNKPSHAEASCSPNAILVFPCRSIIGAAAKGNPGIPGQPKPGSDLISQFTYLEGLLGNHLDIFRTYHAALGTKGNSNATYPFDPSTTEGKAEIHFANRANTYVDINWDPSNWANSSGGNATINKQIDQTAKNIKAVAPHKIFLSPWHEANLHVGAKDNSSQNCSHLASGSNNDGSPDQFIAAWKNIQKRFKADGVTNVIWIWGLGSYTPDNCWVNYMWPGNSSVDWVNYDTYGRKNMLTWDDSSGAFYNYLQSHSTATDNWNSKPWGIGEFGDADAPTVQDAYGYFNNITADVKSNKYPKLKMYMIFADYGSSTQIGSLTDYDNNGSYDAQKQKDINTMFVAMLGGSSTGGQPTPSVSITSPASGATVKGTTSVSASASVTSGSITKLVIAAGGKTIKTCTTGSCTVSWNTKTVSNGTTSISATATASDGKTASTSENITVNNAPPPPSVPANITSPTQTTTSISLSWNASTDANYPSSQLIYHVFRNGTKVGVTAAGTTTFTDKGLAPGTYYSYTVNAGDPAGRTSVQSAAFTQNTKTPNCAKPKPPTGFVAENVAATKVSLKWNAVPDNSSTCKITGYVLSRDSSPIAQTSSTTYDDTTVIANTKYTYSVLAVETGNIAGPSASITVATPKPIETDPGPTAPANLNGNAISTTQINLGWSSSTDAVSGIKQYNILRNGNQAGTASTTSFGDNGLNAGTTYKYQVVAVSGGNKTAASTIISVTTLKATDNSGGGGSGSGGNPSNIPILNNTHSVGSGSDTGQSTSDNPTAGNPNSSSGSGNGTDNNENANNTSGLPNQPAKSSSLKTVAYASGGVLLLLVLSGIALAMRRRRQLGDWTQPTDGEPDVQAGDTIRPNGPIQPDAPPADWPPPQSGTPANSNQPSQPPDGSEEQDSDRYRKGQ